MVLICAINLYFVVSYLPSLPHPAYFSLVALLAAVYLGLTTYLVLLGQRAPWGWGRQGEETTDGGLRGDAPGLPQRSCPLPYSRSPLPQAWTCLITHGATRLAHGSHQHFLYGLPEEDQEEKTSG